MLGPFGKVRTGLTPSIMLAKLGLERRTQAAVLATKLLAEHPR
jgi:hypothetical protein